MIVRIKYLLLTCFFVTNFSYGAGCWLQSGLSNSSFATQLVWPSGIPALDQAYQREGLLLVQYFGVSPRGFYMRDNGSPNAFATSEVINALGPDGTVTFGLELMGREIQRDGGIGFSIPVIMAHEFAHILQFKRGVRLPTKRMELQADFLAGWYLAKRQALSFYNVRPVLESFFQMGDYEFNSPNHHGTPHQRLMALQTGYQLSTQGANLEDAFNQSFSFVSNQ